MTMTTERTSRFHVLAPISALLGSVAILLTGSGLLGTLIPVRASLEAFGTQAIGVLGSAYFLGFAAGGVLGARAVRRVGHIRTFAAMTAITAALPLVHALFVQPLIWCLARAMSGFTFAVLYIVIESWLNERSTRETRGEVMAIYLIINLTVLTIGQMMITLYDPAGFELFVLTSILASLACVPVALTRASAPAPIETVEVHLKRLYRRSPDGFAGCLAVGMANGAFWSLAPLFAESRGFGVAGIAVFMSITVIAGAIGQWPIGKLSDRMDRRKVIIGASFGAVLAGLLLAAVAALWKPLAVVGAILYGLSAFPIYSLSVAHANDEVAPEAFVETASGLLLLYGAGAVIGPLIAAALMSHVGASTLYAYTASVHVALVIFVYSGLRRRPAPPITEHTPFEEALRAAQTVSASFDAQALHDAQENGDRKRNDGSEDHAPGSE